MILNYSFLFWKLATKEVRGLDEESWIQSFGDNAWFDKCLWDEEHFFNRVIIPLSYIFNPKIIINLSDYASIRKVYLAGVTGRNYNKL